VERPLEISFHNFPPSEPIEAEIRRHVEKLDRHGVLIGCRVSIEALHQQHKTGNVIEVHILMSVDGPDIVVSQEPHHANQKFARTDVFASLRRAFQAAERQLKQFKAKQRREAEPHRRRPQNAPVSAEPPARVANRNGGSDAMPSAEQTNAGTPWQGGRREDRKGPERRAEAARPKDTGREGA